MTNTVRVDAAIYASVVNALETVAPLVGKTLREAIVEGPAPGDVLDADSPDPVGVTRVVDREGDFWIREGSGWAVELDGTAFATWSEIQHHYGPVTVIS